METQDFKLLFNESLHKYMDVYGNIYTSMTTVIGKYEPEFEKLKVAKRCTKSKNSKYYGWSVKAVLHDWDVITKASHVKGNRTHEYLENVHKTSTNFNHNYTSTKNGYVTLYTVDDIVNNGKRGELNVDKYLDSGIKDKYPRIYKLFTYLANLGYEFYSEIGVYSLEYRISGLIDILAVNHKTKSFIIIDWKTNKHDLIPYNDEAYKWLSGYFKKDKFGVETNNYVCTNKYYKDPISKYQASHYVTYMLQLNGYANLFSKKGYTLNQLLLCHIRDDKTFESTDSICTKHPEYIGKIKTEIYDIDVVQNDIENMFVHFANGMSNQTTLL